MGAGATDLEQCRVGSDSDASVVDDQVGEVVSWSASQFQDPIPLESVPEKTCVGSVAGVLGPFHPCRGDKAAGGLFL